jgi:deoxyribodipyrimidine photo-lyase
MKYNLFWFRRDLRLHDNRGLHEALSKKNPVIPIFIFDSYILGRLRNKKDPRVTFIYKALELIQENLIKKGSTLRIFVGKPEEIIFNLINQYPIDCIFANKDYEPYAKERDEKIKKLHSNFFTFKDHVIFEENEVTKSDGNPYTVFTPYSKKWKEKFQVITPNNYSIASLEDYFFKSEPIPMPTMDDIGFTFSEMQFPPIAISNHIIKNYDQTRNFPSIQGTSRLGIHFRFGTISIREKAHKAKGLNEVFLNELIWRDFYSMILHHFPRVAENCFKPEYDQIEWVNNEDHFECWCNGMTGYPLVDAGMRELNHTGYMHNRVRMITASFLTKHLLIDWRWGAAYFAEKLLDFDLASNSGGWQWAAGCGTDAAPYFRIFNPQAQQEKFDANFEYIKKWIPELNTSSYPKPIVNHKEAREKCLNVYKKTLKP